MHRLDEPGPRRSRATARAGQPVSRLRSIRRPAAEDCFVRRWASQRSPKRCVRRTAPGGHDRRTDAEGTTASKPKQAPVTSERAVTAREPNHVWHVDLTTVPIHSGLWAPWLPFALPQCWPFCWWVAVVVDHYSRRIMSVGVFANKPNCRMICAFLGRAMRVANAKPKHLVCDRDSIFDCSAFRRWIRRKKIEPPRYGAVGKHGSIAVVERLIRTLKHESARRMIVPMRHRQFRNELLFFTSWYNEHRPHTWLDGRTPNEVYFGRRPANRRPRIEPRKRWPRSSPCAGPRTLVAGKPGDRFSINVDYHAGRRHLPIVTLKRAA